jgi:glutaredoxin
MTQLSVACEVGCLVLVVKDRCGYCRQALTILQNNNIRFMLMPPMNKDHVKEEMGIEQDTFPYVFYQNQLIGGAEELVYLIRNTDELLDRTLPVIVTSQEQLLGIHEMNTLDRIAIV